MEHGEEKAAVEVHIRSGFSDLNGFHSTPLLVPFDSSLYCGADPVDAVVGYIINSN